MVPVQKLACVRTVVQVTLHQRLGIHEERKQHNVFSDLKIYFLVIATKAFFFKDLLIIIKA